MKRNWLIATAAILALSACDGAAGKDRSWVRSSGDWGWGDGAGCADRQDAVDVRKKSLTFYQAGEVVLEATLIDRDILTIEKSMKDGSKVDGITWTYAVTDEAGTVRTYEERFRVRRDEGESVSLVAVPRRFVTVGEDGERMREENRRSGQRLSPCEA